MMLRAVPTEAIVCPTCRAADNSRPDPHGVHTCVYCGARYRLSALVAVAIPKQSAPVSSARLRNLAIIGVVAMLMAAAVGIRFALGSSGVKPPRPPVVRLETEPPIVRNVVAIATAAPEPEPEAPATATFEFHSKATGYLTSYYVLGWVTNTSPFAIDHPKVVAVLLDEAGKEVGTKDGYSTTNDLGAGEKAPIKILISTPVDHAEIRYEIVARKASYRTPRVAGLRIEASSPTRTSYGSSWDVSGKVFHEGKVPARFVRVMILALDDDGKLIGLYDTFAHGTAEILQPGQSARFTALGAFPNTKPARFEFQVEGTAAQN